jgi:hypothetical protein
VPLVFFLLLFLPAALVSALVLVLLDRRRRDAANTCDQIVDAVLQRLEERSRNAPGVDRRDRLLLELLRQIRGSTVVAGIERARNAVALAREGYGQPALECRPRGGFVSGAAPAAGEDERGRERRAQITLSRSGLPPLQA